MSVVHINTYPTLDDAIRTGNIFVINRSDNGGNRKKGVLILPVQTQDGNKITIAIPPTWIPINLLNHATLEDLQKCTILRQYIGRQILVAITPESVKALQDTGDYSVEAERVSKIMHGFEATITPTTMTINTSGSGAVMGSNKTDPNGVGSVQANPIVAKVINAESNQAIVSLLDTELKNITLVDAQQMSLGAASGSFLERLASELEGYLMEDGTLPFNSIEETDTVTLAKADGTFSAPVLSF